MEKILKLPAGCQEVPVSEVPWRIAEAISNTSWIANDHIISISKKIIPYDMSPEEFGQTVPEDELTDNDWEELNEVCEKSNLPSVTIGMSLIKYRLCERAFEKYEADWMLIPYTQNTHAYHTLKSIEESHRKALKEAASKGEVVVYDKLTRIPLSEPIGSEQFRNAFITVAELSRYVTAFDLKVIVGETGIGQITALHTSNTANDKIPGKMPKNTIGKLAIKAAWEIESRTGKYALVDEVIAKLQLWVEQEDALLEIIKDGVSWQTKGLKVNNFDTEACSKALERWHKSRS